MKCPKCVQLGLKSRLNTSGGCSSTCACVSEYYDENGVHHYHDPNTRSSSLRCSNGHRLQINQSSPCGNCDYGRDADGGYVQVFYYPEGSRTGEKLDPKLLTQEQPQGAL